MSAKPAQSLPDIPRIGPAHPLGPLVAEAYEVFDLPAPRSLGVCRGCCMSPGIEADFRNHAPRDLPAAYVADWYFAAFADDLSFANMGWLLPRVLEFLAMDEDAFFYGEEVALARLPLSGFPDRWPPRAVDLVRRFGSAWLGHRVAEGTRYLDETLCTLSNAGLAVGDLIADLDALAAPDLARLLHRTWCEAWHNRIVQTPFWDRQEERSRAWSWYVSPEVEARMVDAGLAGDDRAAAVADLIQATLRGPGA